MHVTRRIRWLSHALAHVLLATAVAIVLLTNVSWALRDNDLRDFGSFLASGRLAAKGTNPYSEDHPLIFMLGDSAAINLNPPVSVVLFRLLAPFDPDTLVALWRLISFGLFVLCVVFLNYAEPEGYSLFRTTWACIMAGLWHTIELGQVYVPLLCLVVAAWFSLRSKRQILSGVLLGALAAMRPQLVLWPAYLLVAGLWPTATVAAITFCILSALPLILCSPHIYAQWLAVASSRTVLPVFNNSSLVSIAGRFGLTSWGYAISGTLIIAFAVLIWKCKPSLQSVSALSIVAALLIGPITWPGYTMLVLPIYWYSRETRLMRFAAMLLAIPIPIIGVFMRLSSQADAILGGVYGYALLLIAVHVALEARSPANLCLQ